MYFSILLLLLLRTPVSFLLLLLLLSGNTRHQFSTLSIAIYTLYTSDHKEQQHWQQQSCHWSRAWCGSAVLQQLGQHPAAAACRPSCNRCIEQLQEAPGMH